MRNGEGGLRVGAVVARSPPRHLVGPPAGSGGPSSKEGRTLDPTLGDRDRGPAGRVRRGRRGRLRFRLQQRSPRFVGALTPENQGGPRLGMGEHLLRRPTVWGQGNPVGGRDGRVPWTTS